MKRVLALVTMMMMVLSLLAGCTPNEVKLLEMNSAVNTLNAYTATGSMHWNMNFSELLGKDATTKEKLVMKTFQDAMTREGIQDLTYTYSVSMSPLAMDAQYYTSKGKSLMGVKLIGDTYYFNVDGILDIVQAQVPADVKNDESYKAMMALKGKYLSVSLTEMSNSSANSAFALQYKKSLESQVKLQKMATDKFLGFVKSDLGGYNPGIVTKTYDSAKGADVYGYSIQAENMPLMAMEFALYLTDHTDGLKTLVKSIAATPEFREMTSTKESADAVSKGIDEGFAEMTKNMATVKTQLAAALKDEKEKGTYKKMAETYAKGSEFSTHTAQLSDGKYWTDVNLKLRLNIPDVPFKTLDLTMDMTITPKSSVSITAPANVVPFKVLNDSLQHTVVYTVDDKTYEYTPGMMNSQFGDADLRIVNGRTFLAISAIPEHFRTKAFTSMNPISINGKPVAAKNLINKGDVSFVAVSALRDAGLTVTWDANERTITLED